MILHGYWQSTTTYRVRAALNLKGLPYKEVSVDLMANEHLSGAFRALNSAASVPVLVLDDGTALTQSLAILDYLDALAKPRLLPTDPLLRARVMAAAHTIALDVHPVNNLRVVRHMAAVHGADAAAGQAWMVHWMRRGFAALEPQLAPDTPFAFGTKPGLADLCIVAQTYNAHRWGLDLAPFPRISRVEAACLAHPAIAAAHPKKQPDAKAA